MRKTLNINLGGIAFIMDENAYELMHGYLEALKQKFSNEAERDEILNDIEARMAEMLNQKLGNRKEVVSVIEVQQVIDIMGRPEDIAGEETFVAEEKATTQPNPVTATGPVKRRLYRDPDDAKISGVISGLCHYFGINDPVWVRIAAVILIFVTSGSIILLYLLLAIVVPKANTAAEKLQMKGEPINIATIQKEVKDAAVRTGQSVHQFVKEENFFEKVWGIFASIFKVVFKLFVIFLIIIAMIGLVAVVSSFTAVYLLGTTSLADASRLLVDNPATISIFSFGYLLFLMPPLLALIYLCLKVLVGERSRVRWLKWALLGGWLIGLFLVLTSVYKTAIQFSSEATRKDQMVLMQPTNGALMVQLTDELGNKFDENSRSDDFQINDDGVVINGTNLRDMTEVPLGKPQLELMASEGDSFYIQEITTSRGRNKKDAEKNAANVIYKFNQTDSILNLNAGLCISKHGKFRDQKMVIRIAIPEGKKIRFADNIDHWSAVVKGDNNYDDTQFANTVWTVTGGKVKCIEGENHSRDEAEDHRSSHMHTRVRVHDTDSTDSDSGKEDF